MHAKLLLERAAEKGDQRDGNEGTKPPEHVHLRL